MSVGALARLARQTRSQPQLQAWTIPAPVAGLNAKHGLPSMQPNEAIVLDNYFPETTYVRLRRGFSDWATGITGDVTSIFEWQGPATSKLKAAISDKIYDITSSGAVGAAELSSLTNGKWQHCQFTTSGGNFLVICNGADSVRNYDGTTWTTPAITGVSSAALINVWPHKSRLWFVQTGTTKAWYLPTNSIAGAATEFDLGSQFVYGGKLKLIGTLSRDSGDGLDDYIVFISSQGEFVVYQGTDPASASTWAKVGNYRAGPPVGDRALVQVAGDLGVITQDGAVSLMGMMQVDRASSARAAITDKISDLFSDDYEDFGSLYGWQAMVHPTGHMLICNVPTSDSAGALTARQYVMNTMTGAWCRFTGHNAACWGRLGDTIYFGGTNGVWKADTGTADDGADIPGHIDTAFNYLGGPGRKHIKNIRPIIGANALPEVAIRANWDFEHNHPSTDDIFNLGTVTGSGVWGTSLWGTGTWAGGEERYAFWYDASGIGDAMSISIQTATQGVSMNFYSFDIQFERMSRYAL